MALENIFTTIGAAAVGLVTSLLIGFGGGSIVKDANRPPDPRAIVPVSLKWDAGTGRIGQLLRVEGESQMNGTWGAAIWRGNIRLCGGGGASPYPLRAGREEDTKWMTPDEWTGGKCPTLQPGDRASATWEWRAGDGSLRSASMELVIR